jgi:hypothetical protein
MNTPVEYNTFLMIELPMHFVHGWLCKVENKGSYKISGLLHLK